MTVHETLLELLNTSGQDAVKVLDDVSWWIVRSRSEAELKGFYDVIGNDDFRFCECDGFHYADKCWHCEQSRLQA